MESQQAEEYEGLAEDFADMMVMVIKFLVQVFLRVEKKMPFEEWFDIYMEEQGYRQEEFKERINRTHEEFDGLPDEDKLIMFDIAFRKIPKKVERLEIPGPVKGFFSNLITLIKPLTAEQSEVYECDNCHQQFMIPRQGFEKVKCPGCGKEWTKEELPKLRKK